MVILKRGISLVIDIGSEENFYLTLLPGVEEKRKQGLCSRGKNFRTDGFKRKK